jgi:membrane protein
MGAMDPVRKAVGAVDGFQRRHRWVGVPYAVQKKFGDDNANLVVVALAWYGFLAIFPLLLVVVTIFNLIGAGSLGTTLVDTLKEFPVIGTDFTASSDKSLNGSTVGLIVGLLGLIYGVQGSWRWRRCGISRRMSAPASCRGSAAAWPG